MDSKPDPMIPRFLLKDQEPPCAVPAPTPPPPRDRSSLVLACPRGLVDYGPVEAPSDKSVGRVRVQAFLEDDEAIPTPKLKD